LIYPFDDYLGLASQSLVYKQLIVFKGCSGAGKSSYIEFLLEQHPDFCKREVFRTMDGRPLTWNQMVPVKPSLIVVDELLYGF